MGSREKWGRAKLLWSLLSRWNRPSSISEPLAVYFRSSQDSRFRVREPLAAPDLGPDRIRSFVYLHMRKFLLAAIKCLLQYSRCPHTSISPSPTGPYAPSQSHSLVLDNRYLALPCSTFLTSSTTLLQVHLSTLSGVIESRRCTLIS